MKTLGIQPRTVLAGAATVIVMGVLGWMGSAVVETRDAMLKVNGRLEVMSVRMDAATSDRYTGRMARAELDLRDERLRDLTRRVGKLEGGSE